MRKVYQPKISDPDMKIRHTVAMVRKQTHIDKSIIAERLILYAVEHVKEVFASVNAKNDAS